MKKAKAALELAFKAVGVSMGIVTIILIAVKAADTETYLVLLGMGVFALGLAGISEYRAMK